MRKSNSLIATVNAVSGRAEARDAVSAGAQRDSVTIAFDGGRSGRLEMGNPRAAVWAGILDLLRRERRPAYVEIDPDSGIITEVLVPLTGTVVAIGETPDEVRVTFLESHAVHHLHRSNPDYDDLLHALQTAKSNGFQVAVTATRDEHEIIDVTPLVALLPPSPGPGPGSGPAPGEQDGGAGGGAAPSTVTEARAQELFDLMASRTCDPTTVPPPCIPFRFPDDGCYARAHEMIRLMRLEPDQVEAEKVWIYGSLNPLSANHPDCEVSWWYHVAPTLQVTTSSGTEKRVIDPSLASGPISPDDWRTIQRDAAATLEFTDATPFFPHDGPDDDYSQTNYYLNEKRLLLQDRTMHLGPPPYSCPIAKSCQFIVDRSTFGESEVAALLQQQGNPAVIDAAFYVIVDGFTPQELGIDPGTPHGPPSPGVTPSFLIQSVPEMSAAATQFSLEDPHLNRRQRITWTYQVSFSGTGAFAGGERTVALSASIGGVSANASLSLITQPNPYEVDGSVSWLSDDVRVFQIKTGETRFGATMGSDASAFIKQVIDNLENHVGPETFDDISTNQQTSKLELSQTVGGTAVFNFAVARVRYRSVSETAGNVRVFFRLFPASTTSLDYQPSTTYRLGADGGTTIAVPGIQGGNLVTIPCFAEPRVDSTVQPLNEQTDSKNVQDIGPGAGGAESHAHFGAWLDINQTAPQLPLNPSPMDGPFAAADRKSIQELIRNRHQCLVAEIFFDLHPGLIPAGATPGSSDKLAQRNLAIVESDNPGVLASHRIPNTFEIRPTPQGATPGGTPDELMIDWGTTPAGSLATLFFSGVETNDILALAARTYRKHGLVRVDAHTLQCRTAGITYIPIPTGGAVNFTGMISIDLPSTVKKGQVFTVVVRQVTNVERPIFEVTAAFEGRFGGWRRILGTFQITIPVRTAAAILDEEERLLKTLRSIEKTIPEDNRWSAVFSRYVKQTSERVNALGTGGIVISPPSTTLPHGTVNPPAPYKQTFTATGGTPPYRFEVVVPAALAPGLSLSAAGVLSGTPKLPGRFNFAITASDSAGASARPQVYTIVVG